MKLRVADDVVFRELADEAVLLHLDSGMYFGLDEVGTRCWQLLAEHGSPHQVVQTLMAEYEVEEEQLCQDVDGLIQQLLDKGLMLVDTEESPAPG